MGKELNLKTGKIGEKLAKEYLKKKGYQIIEENYRTRFSELDLVAKEGKELVFIEVRTRKGESFGRPEESFQIRKLKKLFLAARSYISQKAWKASYRVDAICLVLSRENRLERINHYQAII